MSHHLEASNGALIAETELRRAPLWTSLTLAVKSALDSYREQAQSRRAYRRLHTMSAHELEDIGLTCDMVQEAESDLGRKPFGPI